LATISLLFPYIWQKARPTRGSFLSFPSQTNLSRAFTLDTIGVSLSKKPAAETLSSHELVPDHVVLSADAKQKVLEKYRATDEQFPRILPTDPAIKGLGAKAGDLIQIKRKDVTGEYSYYRMVSRDD